MQLSKKPKNFYECFIALLSSTSHSQHFEKKDEPHRSSNSEIMDWVKSWLLKCLKDCVSGHP